MRILLKFSVQNVRIGLAMAHGALLLASQARDGGLTVTGSFACDALLVRTPGYIKFVLIQLELGRFGPS